MGNELTNAIFHTTLRVEDKKRAEEALKGSIIDCNFEWRLEEGRFVLGEPHGEELGKGTWRGKRAGKEGGIDLVEELHGAIQPFAPEVGVTALLTEGDNGALAVVAQGDLILSRFHYFMEASSPPLARRGGQGVPIMGPCPGGRIQAGEVVALTGDASEVVVTRDEGGLRVVFTSLWEDDGECCGNPGAGWDRTTFWCDQKGVYMEVAGRPLPGCKLW